jgi:SET domain-containing protein
VFKTEHKGWGVRTLQAIPKGSFVCDYVGEVIDQHKAEQVGKIYDAKKRSYLFDLDILQNSLRLV